MKETQHIFHTTKVDDDCYCQAPKFTSESTIALSQEQPKIPDLSWYFIVLFSVSIYCLFFFYLDSGDCHTLTFTGTRETCILLNNSFCQ